MIIFVKPYLKGSGLWVKLIYDEYLSKVRDRHRGYNHNSETHREPLMFLLPIVCSWILLLRIK